MMEKVKSEHTAYAHVQAYLEALHLSVTASYMFGFFVANILKGNLNPESNLSDFSQAVKLDKKQLSKLQPVIEPLIELLYKNLSAEWFTMDPLLPNNELPLSARIFSLREFLQAFLTVITDDIATCCEVNDEVHEIFDDFKILSQMDMDTDDSEDSEKDFTEIVEYIKISIMLLTEHAHFFIQQKQAKENQIHH